MLDYLAGIGVASPAPCREFHRVDTAVADLGPVDHRIVHLEPLGEVPLR